jgi:hypothetical protein
MAQTTKTKTNSDGDLIVELGDDRYAFRHPRGRDLVAMERTIKAEGTECEAMAALMASLSIDGYDSDHFLDLAVEHFKTLSVELNTFFRPLMV